MPRQFTATNGRCTRGTLRVNTAATSLCQPRFRHDEHFCVRPRDSEISSRSSCINRAFSINRSGQFPYSS